MTQNRNASMGMSPDSLKTAVYLALERTAVLGERRITVTTDRGAVTLRGTVHSASEKSEAAAVAWSAPGVTGVSNQLRAALWGPSPSGL